MSNRKQPTDGSNVRIPDISPASPPLTLLDIGRRIITLIEPYGAFDEAQTKAEQIDDHSKRMRSLRMAKRGVSLTFKQQEALVDLGLLMVPQTLADVAAQLSMVDRRMDMFRASEVSEDEMRDFLGATLHVLRAALPHHHRGGANQPWRNLRQMGGVLLGGEAEDLGGRSMSAFLTSQLPTSCAIMPAVGSASVVKGPKPKKPARRGARLQEEMDVDARTAERERRRRMLELWDRLPPEEQARVRTERGYALDGPDPLPGAIAADYGAVANAAAHAAGVGLEQVLTGLLQHYAVTGNPIFALQAIAQWPDASPLHPLLREYLQRSLQPLLTAAAAISLGDPAAISPADASKMVAEWFGLAGLQGSENAFSQHRDIIEVLDADDAFRHHLKIERGKKTRAAEAAAKELDISISTLAERRNAALRLKARFAGLSSGGTKDPHVNNAKSPARDARGQRGGRK